MSDVTTSNKRFSGLVGSLEISMFVTLFFIKLCQRVILPHVMKVCKAEKLSYVSIYGYVSLVLCIDMPDVTAIYETLFYFIEFLEILLYY